ncbi:MAG: archaemetzincin family Zn-dependent metalloprotease [Acidobacteriota bacterium]
MNRLTLMPVGTVDGGVLAHIAERCALEYGWNVKIDPPIAMPLAAFDAKRNQYEAIHILRAVIARAHPDSDRTLGIVNEDLFIPMLTFVFGQAQIRGKVALMSLARLGQEYYGLPPNPPLFLKRAEKETLHELGHTFGLIHCASRDCVMALSNSIQQVDQKQAEYCRSCAILLHDSLRTIETDTQRKTQ